LITALLDNSGNVVERYAYDPFGAQTVYNASWNARTSSSYSFTVGWQGKYLDTVCGLNLFDERWYSPTLGRPLQTDPIGFAGDTVNLYQWEGNRPTSSLDPIGFQELKGTSTPGPLGFPLNSPAGRAGVVVVRDETWPKGAQDAFDEMVAEFEACAKSDKALAQKWLNLLRAKAAIEYVGNLHDEPDHNDIDSEQYYRLKWDYELRLRDFEAALLKSPCKKHFDNYYGIYLGKFLPALRGCGPDAKLPTRPTRTFQKLPNGSMRISGIATIPPVPGIPDPRPGGVIPAPPTPGIPEPPYLIRPIPGSRPPIIPGISEPPPGPGAGVGT
jgi:RHS repeat-associated protein